MMGMFEEVPAPDLTSEAGPWYLYLLRLANGHLYTGITTDVARRFAEHAAGAPKGAKCLRGRGPLQLVHSQPVGSRVEALRAEWAVKRLPRHRKEQLVEGRLTLETILSAKTR